MVAQLVGQQRLKTAGCTAPRGPATHGSISKTATVWRSRTRYGKSSPRSRSWRRDCEHSGALHLSGCLVSRGRGFRRDRSRAAIVVLVDKTTHTRAEAFDGIQRLAEEVVNDLEANGEPVPDALSDRNFSGRFVVRVPAEVRRQLVRDAAEQHVSLNRLVSSRLMGP